ncbi:uncharacterized protein LOC111018515 [Momordica charantia]|uniref:Uncharacterized protein LOC111018515 n=1 Tax=Momordica charantia TaxID=3673 RepID=A0A6J1D949_MOMCH|nr:uncharacterized protein LOC111018515 [Momordica charantia]
MAYPLPLKMKKPDMKPYDGSTDPIDHINLYEGLMELNAVGDEMKCQAFSVTLKGQARSWYGRVGKVAIETMPNTPSRFSRETVAAEGCTDLPVTIVENDNKVRKVTEFVMVDGATYQRLVNMMFNKQIGRNMEVYVNDMLVKSLMTKQHVADLTEAFSMLNHYQMKLNPTKCVFGVSSRKFLGFMVNHRVLEANPDKIKAVLEMESPKNLKQLQCLNGRIAALNRTSNNEAEYEALLAGLRLAQSMGADCLLILSDSRLIVNQVMD